MAFSDEDDGVAQGQRHRLRARGRRVDARRPPRAPRRRPPARRLGLDQRLPRGGAELPFGGYKSSGIGRENGSEVLREYLETKAVWVELSGATRDPFVLG